MTERMEWQPIASAPLDGAFRFYGLYVTYRQTGFRWFEAHYVALDSEIGLISPSGDGFSDWSYEDFEVWAPAPMPPADGVAEDGNAKG